MPETFARQHRDRDGGYMNPDHLAAFSRQLNALRENTLATIRQAQNTLGERAEPGDEADRAQHEEDTRLALRTVERETRLLRKIDAALRRIRDGEYGYCLESGEEIGLERLRARPTAEYCAEVKVQMEEKEKHYGKR
ncbi:TraR/DksA family transcriptional regulator [Spongiibacter tropicus]|uniref:TraR/DksA family transcriptional regulator n=2 Tax=Spongiibacter tropicus TaxID=454602 RepID=UPI0024E1A1FF|nr:TraR/DksA C4-type zinc finger protein [Spongiibacter tropicus]